MLETGIWIYDQCSQGHIYILETKMQEPEKHRAG